MWLCKNIFGSFPAIKLAKNQDTNPVLEILQINSDSNHEITLNNVLKNDEMLNIFFSHILREFSVENLIAAIEFTNYTFSKSFQS